MVNNTPLLFLKKRAGRLIPTYYIYLTLTFIIIIVILGWNSLSIRQIVGHYLFLNWFIDSMRIHSSPQPQLGHLWFMSGILFGYILVVLWSRLINWFPYLRTNKSWVIFFCCVSFIASVVTLKIRIMVYPFTIILAFTLLFFKGNIIMDWGRSIKPWLLVSLLVLGNIISIGYYLCGGY